MNIPTLDTKVADELAQAKKLLGDVALTYAVALAELRAEPSSTYRAEVALKAEERLERTALLFAGAFMVRAANHGGR